MTMTIAKDHEARQLTLEYWPDSVRNNPKREKDLPRLVVPLFGPVGPAYVADSDDAYGTAD